MDRMEKIVMEFERRTRTDETLRQAMESLSERRHNGLPTVRNGALRSGYAREIINQLREVADSVDRIGILRVP